MSAPIYDYGEPAPELPVIPFARAAHAAFVAELADGLPDWDAVDAKTRAAWEAASRAVVDQIGARFIGIIRRPEGAELAELDEHDERACAEQHGDCACGPSPSVVDAGTGMFRFRVRAGSHRCSVYADGVHVCECLSDRRSQGGDGTLLEGQAVPGLVIDGGDDDDGEPLLMAGSYAEDRAANEPD